jgi:hypothetical protein
VSKAEERRTEVIVQLERVLTYAGVPGPRLAAEMITDHINAHAVETVFDILAAEERLAREREAQGSTG